MKVLSIGEMMGNIIPLEPFVPSFKKNGYDSNLWYCNVCNTVGSAHHKRKKTHAILMRAWEPQQDARLKPHSLVEVKFSSEAYLQEYLWSFAKAGSAELEWASMCPFPRNSKHYYVGDATYYYRDRFNFIFTDEHQCPIGGCSFMATKVRDAPSSWVLQWIWITPSARRQGLLSHHWPTFVWNFGVFIVGEPNEHMEAFLEKRGHPRRGDHTKPGAIDPNYFVHNEKPT